MAASAPAAVPTAAMILLGEDHRLAFEVGVPGLQADSLEASLQRQRVPADLRIAGDDLQARAAEAARLRQFAEQAVDRRSGQNGFLTPAAALVAFTRFVAAAIRLRANGTMCWTCAELHTGSIGLGGRTCESARAYWQASQTPPFRMASMEQAFFSSAVNSRFSAAGLRSRLALSMALLFSVRR